MSQLMVMQESETTPCVVGGLVLLSAKDDNNNNIEEKIHRIDRKAFEERLKERLLQRYVRFRSILVSESEYIDIGVDEVCLENHVKYEMLNLSKEKSEDEILSELIGSRLFSPFKPVENSQVKGVIPLWECIVIENYSRGLILFFRIHHWIGDGTLLQKIVGTDLLDNEKEASEYVQSKFDKIMKGSHSNWNSALTIINNLTGKLNRIPLLGSLVSYCIGFFLKILAFVATFFLILGIGVKGEPDTMFRASKKHPKCGQVTCSFIWFNDTEQLRDDENDLRNETDKYFTVPEFKKVAKKLDGKLNDLFLSLLSGASDRYRLKLSAKESSNMQEREKLLSTTNARMGMGVNIRSTESKSQSGNIVGVIFGSIPLNIQLIEEPQKRFETVRNNMNFAKFLPQPYFNRYLLWLGTALLPKKMAVSLMNWGAASTTFTCSNVQGFEADDKLKYTMLGRNIVQGAGFIPLVSAVAVNCTLMTFNDRVGLSIVCDKGIIQDIHMYAECFREEFIALRKSLDL
ncbi:predicted protein [Naegleria gruberi]|uniref:Predicted protein n=1 Tax=Naegleria gruberi TaxID=5762 RepID=D2VWA7_NAEGR|nr:uncharacterized protein NAEGRDRAFT_73315 [Naegleria gruberi]EFC38868.1 predicted protein [Naegleria gruberi]|eukprot:XP_002671612.1 predicted protein [Naegleria gruberi strain NEG-M]